MSRLRDLLRRKPRRTAFVLSGGGNLGALQVGMLRALFERRIEPDLVLGCSVGRLQEVWRGIADHDVMPAGLLSTVQLARRGTAIHTNANLRRVIESVLPVARFEDLLVPFQCVATAMVEGSETWFDAGLLVDPILASSAIPAVYPPVEIDGRKYLDGAIVNDVPVTRAVALGADRIFVLHVGSWDRPRPEPKRPLDMATYAYWLARRSRFQRDLSAIPDDIEVLVLPPGGTPLIRYNDFGHSDEMIATAYQATSVFLDSKDHDPDDDLAAAVPTVHASERPAGEGTHEPPF